MFLGNQRLCELLVHASLSSLCNQLSMLMPLQAARVRNAPPSRNAPPEASSKSRDPWTVISVLYNM